MLYTFSSAHLAAIREAHNNLRTLSHLVPVLDKDGEPYYSGGASSVVFKMKDEQTGKCYALKCFTEKQEGRAEAYRQIEEELKFVDSPYITSVKYLEKELFVDSDSEDNEHPVLLMDWIEGKTMEAYINANFMDSHAMAMLYYQFCKMVDWLRSQSFAHGDIRLDNIIVRPDGTLTLVDYDDMFVPAMKGRKSPTISTKNLPHPLRTIDDFGETTDDFALVSIALSLKAISLDSSLLQNYGASDRLLFAPFEYFDLSMRNDFAPLQDLLNAVEDEFGVKYSKDWKRLLKAPQNLEGEYSIREGAKVIEKKAFSECNSLKSVIIPNSVTIIEEWAFLGCCSLRSIDIPDSVTKMGVSAFRHCNSLKSVNISGGVTSIGDSAFVNCESLKTINIPDSVTSIGDYAFADCGSLKSVNIPDSVTSIGNSAFSNCSALKSINIPNSVTSIRDNAFENCTSLKSITIPNSVTSIEHDAFSGCSSLMSIHMPDSVTSIGYNAFEGCISLKSINIPNSVTSIGMWTFYYCKSLKSINIPDSVTTIGDKAFSYCESLLNINIPNGVTSIGDSAFSDCISLISITIPSSVIAIGMNPFYGCPADLKNESKAFIYEHNVLFNKDKTTLISYRAKEANYVIPDSVTSIGECAFLECNSLTSIIIPDSVTSIGVWAFAQCNSLTSINIPDSVTTIGNHAFYNCKSLTSINISNGMMSIGDNAFEGCVSLKSIKIPDSVTSIGDYAFGECDSLSPQVKSDIIQRFGENVF